MECQKCRKQFSRVDNRKRHEAICGNSLNLFCPNCGVSFTRLDNRTRHMKSCNIMPDNVTGGGVGISSDVSSKSALSKNSEPATTTLLSMKPTDDDDDVIEYETAFTNRLKSYFIQSNSNSDITRFLNTIKEKIATRLYNSIIEYSAIKFNLTVDCVMKNQQAEEIDVTLKTKNKSLLQGSCIEEKLARSFSKLEKELEECQLKKSSWSLKEIIGLRLKINKYKPLGGSTYVRLPNSIQKKKACINVQNNDNECFRYSILAKLVKNKPHRTSSYRYLQHNYNFNCVRFPTPLEDIKKFETVNNMSINVFGLDVNQHVYPLRITNGKEKENHRDLLLISNKNGIHHYVYIKQFEKLVHSQITTHCDKIIICKRCFIHFDKRHNGKTKLKEHLKLCGEKKPVRIEMPTDKYIEFKHVEKALRVPFVVYADFEAILEPIQNCQPNPSVSYTLPYQKHIPLSFCVYLKFPDYMIRIDESLPKEPYLYRGPNAAAHFLQYLQILAKKVSAIYSRKLEMNPLTDEEKINHFCSSKCFMCDKPFISPEDKVHDHCHITGQYRGSAHNLCNLRFQNPKFLPVLFHNLSGYDAHFIVHELGYDKKAINVIPNSEEKYISFSKKIDENITLRFIDTIRFVPGSLDKLVKNVPKLREVIKFFPQNQISVLTRKGVFPYDYVTSWDKLNEPCLPSKEYFYNRLLKQNISDDDYAHAQSVWNEFKCNNLGEYSDIYLKTDVLLLADVFETFRDVTLNTHKLDPCNYFTLPGLSWDAMLRFTGVRLELIQDYDQILMIENGIRGGICQVSHRYAIANNKYMQTYNKSEPSTYITYQDCNNLYGYAMSQPLPESEFTWVSPDNFNLDAISKHDQYGFILEVDINYPLHLHTLHNDLPFLAENVRISSQKKLVPHLKFRSNYVVHCMTLKQAIKHGLEVVKIHRVLRFKQSQWLKPYILHNTKLRAAAVNNFEKDLYKLYNNSVYGKTMENIRKRLNVKLVCDPKLIEKLIAKPNFIERTIYGENVAAIHMHKTSIKFDKPVYVGMSVLDLSKKKMYKYHYDVMVPYYGPERLKLAYMDTDSFIYLIKTDDLYLDLVQLLSYLDTSDYPINHPCYSNKNKKIIGKFKDEVNGKIIEAFVGLRAKMYAIKLTDSEIRKAKGIQTASLKKSITFNDYVNCLKQSKNMRTLVNVIRSKQHVINTIEINKLSLSPFDDKRIILEDNISTKPIGSKA